MRKVRCEKCGCDRVLMVKADVRNQEDGMQISTKWLCFTCLLQAVNLYDSFTKTYNYKNAMAITGRNQYE